MNDQENILEIPVRQQVTLQPADEPGRWRMSLVCHESIGKVIIFGRVTYDYRWYEEEPVSDSLVATMMQDASE